MYGIGYVIIPMEIASLQRALDETLAPFQRGGPDDFPHEKLAFNDVTGQLRNLHGDPITLTLVDGGIGVRNHGTAGWYLDDKAMLRFLQTVDTGRWSGRLSDVEPDFDRFAHRFTKWKERDPLAGGYGNWLNPLGRWDWWELGGRFDGVIVGDRRPVAGQNSSISSGPSRGRDVLGNVMRVFGAETPEFEAEISSNVDLVSTLLEAARRGEGHAFPTAIVLPVDACADGFRWFDTDRGKRIPQETKALLTVPDDATFEETALAAYERFSDMAVAGIAYHF